MKKIALVLPVLVAVFTILSASAYANAIDNLVITGTYDNSASSTMFSGPGDTFTLSFSLPTTLQGLVDASIPVTIGFGGSTTTLAKGVITFFPGSRGGGFNIDVIGFPDLFEWQLEGPQLFDSSGNLLLGQFATVAIGTLVPQLTDNNNTVAFITGGTIAISSATTGVTPEPSSLFLLGTGLLGLGPLIRRRLARA